MSHIAGVIINAAILFFYCISKIANADRCPVNFSFILVVIVNIFHQETYYRGRSKVMSTGCRTNHAIHHGLTLAVSPTYHMHV